MTLTQCPECGGKVSTLAEACPHCGAKRAAPAGTTSPAAAQRDSAAFAAITLAFWLLAAPVGLVLNLVGVFTGPRRGCFVSMLAVFVGLPLLAVVGVFLLGGGWPALQEWMKQLMEALEGRIPAPG